MGTVDAAEIAHFSKLAEQWWDASGPFRPLHVIAPLRIGYIRDQACARFGRDAQSAKPLSGLRLADIGCGGGLISEPMARLGARVTGVDASEKNIGVASLHAQQAGLDIDYQCMTAEELASSVIRHPPSAYDIVLALEIIEHVADVGAFVEAMLALLKPGGLLIMSTINRTVKSYALAIVGAEYVLRWVPRGTHQWNKFLRPSEVVREVQRYGGEVFDMTGMVMNPLTFQWSLTPKDLSVNYLLAATRAQVAQR